VPPLALELVADFEGAVLCRSRPLTWDWCWPDTRDVLHAAQSARVQSRHIMWSVGFSCACMWPVLLKQRLGLGQHTQPCPLARPAYFGLVALKPGMSGGAVSVLPLGLPAAVEPPLQVHAGDAGCMRREVRGRPYALRQLRALLGSAALQAGGWVPRKQAHLEPCFTVVTSPLDVSDMLSGAGEPSCCCCCGWRGCGAARFMMERKSIPAMPWMLSC
jgi:hypothetical protein